MIITKLLDLCCSIAPLVSKMQRDESKQCPNDKTGVVSRKRHRLHEEEPSDDESDYLDERSVDEDDGESLKDFIVDDSDDEEVEDEADDDASVDESKATPEVLKKLDIDPGNIVSGKRARRQADRYVHPDYATLILADVPPEELPYAVADSDEEQSSVKKAARSDRDAESDDETYRSEGDSEDEDGTDTDEEDDETEMQKDDTTDDEE